MKLLPEVPTQEMWDRAWNEIKANDELARAWKVLSVDEIRMLFDHFFKVIAAAPEVRDEPVGWCKDGAIEEGRAKKQSIVVWTDKYSDTPVELFLHPSPRIAELEAEVAAASKLIALLKKLPLAIDADIAIALVEYDKCLTR